MREMKPEWEENEKNPPNETAPKQIELPLDEAEFRDDEAYAARRAARIERMRRRKRRRKQKRIAIGVLTVAAATVLYCFLFQGRA